MLTLEQYEQLALAAQANPQPLIEETLWVQTKGLPGQQPVQKLILNRAQRRVHEAVEGARRAGIPPRIIILKARQPGISTLCCGYAVATAQTVQHANCMLITHIDTASVRMFRKVDFMLEKMPADLRPLRGVDRRDEIELLGVRCEDGFYELRSSVMIATAGGQEPWRSITLQMAHLSEFAFYPNPGEVLAGVMQAVPPSPTSLVVIESTANRMGDEFHEQWVRAVGGESDFTPIFIGWWEIPEYAMVVPQGFKLTPEEKRLKEAFGLVDEQIQWRRYAIQTQCGGDVDFFNREYPDSPERAFLVAGRSAFDKEVLAEMAMRAREVQPEIGSISMETGFQPTGTGMLKVYRRPEAGHDYTLGADPSSGVPGRDYAAAHVFDRDRGEIVATLHGHVGPIPFAHMIFALGRWYNWAVVAPEVNGGFGFTVIEELQALHYEEGRMYVWRRVDVVRSRLSNFLGWQTSFRTRQQLVDTAAHMIKDRAVMIWDEATIMEFLEFQYDDMDRPSGMKHDDLCMAGMIALRVHVEWPLLSTGLPPRILLDDPAPKAQVDPGPFTQGPLSGMEKETWDGVEQDLERMARGGQGASVHDEYVNIPPVGLQREPDIPW